MTTEDEGQDQQSGSGLRAELEKQIEARKQAEAKAEEALQFAGDVAKDRVFDKAGVPEDGAGKYFRQGWKPPEGAELTADLVREAAQNEGIIPMQGQAPAQQPAQQAGVPAQQDPGEVIAAQQAIAGMVQSGGTPASQPDPVKQQLVDAGQYGEGSKDDVMAKLRAMGLPPDADSHGDATGW